jgi:hypothetical protein
LLRQHFFLGFRSASSRGFKVTGISRFRDRPTALG